MNKVLKRLFPISSGKTHQESPKWSEDSGLLLRGKPMSTGNGGSMGLIDSMPVGAHFKMRIYDDMITLEKSPTRT